MISDYVTWFLTNSRLNFIWRHVILITSRDVRFIRYGFHVMFVSLGTVVAE